MSLFNKHENIADPLAYRMAPRTLDEYAGQEHILGEGKLLRRAIEADRITSLILYGPPGTGKTALAQVIANKTNARFEWLNAATVGLDELRRVIKKARAEKKRAPGPYSSLMRFTDSTSSSRMRSCLMWKKEILHL